MKSINPRPTTWRKLALSTLLLGALGLAGCGALVAARTDALETRAEATHPPGGQIIDVDGVPVHAVVSGTGPDVVLIHGASGNTRDWTFSFVERLAQDFRVIVFDRPGLGYTGRTNLAYTRAFSDEAETLDEQAALLAQAARQLGAEAPLVVGQSYGGAVALAWALEHPAAGVVVVAGVSNPWPGELDRLYRVNGSPLGGSTAVPLISALLPRAHVAGVLDEIFAPNPVPEGYAEFIGAGLSLRVDSLRANARQVRSLRPQIVAMAPRYGEISLPVEIVHGEADTIVPLSVHSERLVTQIPGARLTRLPGVGHMPHHAAPEAVEAAIRRASARAGLR